MASEQQLPDDVPHRERDSCKGARSRSRRRRRRSVASRAGWYVFAARGEVCEQVQRPRHQHRAVRARDRACASRARRRGPAPSPFSEPSTSPSVASSSADSARVLPTPSRPACRPSGRQRGEHPVGVLVAEDRRDDDVAPVGQARQEPADAVEVVRAVPDLERRLRDAARAGRAADRRRPRPDRPAAEEGLGRGDGEREVAAAREHRRSLPRSERAPATPARRGRPWRPSGRPRASRRAISSRVSPS